MYFASLTKFKLLLLDVNNLTQTIKPRNTKNTEVFCEETVEELPLIISLTVNGFGTPSLTGIFIPSSKREFVLRVCGDPAMFEKL